MDGKVLMGTCLHNRTTMVTFIHFLAPWVLLSSLVGQRCGSVWCRTNHKARSYMCPRVDHNSRTLFDDPFNLSVSIYCNNNIYKCMFHVLCINCKHHQAPLWHNKLHLGLPVFGILTEMYIQCQVSLGMSQMSLKTRMCQIPIARIQLIICTTILN